MAAARVDLRSARQRAGLTQRALAERVGMPASTVGRIERGDVDPRVGTLAALASALGADLALVDVAITRADGPTLERWTRTVASAVAANDADTALRSLIQLMDDGRSGRIVDLDVDPGSTGSRRWDAFNAAAVAEVAGSTGRPTPAWTLEPSRFLDAPWFPAEDILGRPLSVPIAGYVMSNAPSEFYARGVLIDPATLASV